MILARLIDNRFHEALGKLSAASLPLKTAFKLKGIAKIVREEHSKYEEVRQVALKNHGKKDDNGELIVDEKGNVNFDAEGIAAFSKDIEELTNMELNIPTIKLSELGNINLTVGDLEQLDGIIVED